MTDQQDLQVITRNMSSYRLVHLLYQCDADLFDAIQEWKNQHPDLWVDDAIDAFASARGSDALAQLVYSTEAFDIILKFSASSKDLESIFDSHSRYSQSQHASSIAPKSPLTDQQQQGQGGYNLFGTPSHLESPCQSLPNQSSTDSSVAQPLDCFTDLSPSAQTPSTANNVSQAASPSFVLDANTNHQNSPYPSPSSSSILAQDYKPQQQQQPDALGEAQRVRKRRHRRPSRAKMKEWKTRLHRCNYQLALLKEGLFLELEKSINSDAVFVKVLAPFWRLAEEAQTTNCKAELAVNSIMMRTESGNNPYGRKMGLRSALRHGAYSKLFALHDGPYKLQSKPLNEANDRAQLRVRWARRFWRSQPLDLVNAYYGERIGIYFAWLGHYTKWLTLPSIVGLAVFIFGVINAANLNQLDATPNVLFAIFDNALTMPFALFMSLWSTIYIEFWKRANQYYAFCWNMIDYERVELPRTEFRPTRVRFSPVTGKREMYYPAYRKALHIFASSVAVVIAIWCRLAEWLTDKENHKYTDSYEDSLIIKRYLFDFANMYATLFYYAFFKAPFGGRLLNRHDLRDTCIYDSCITELSVQLAVVFIGKQFLNGLFESVFPWIKKTWHRKRIFAEQALQRLEFLQTRKQSRAPEWVKDDELPGYDGRILKCYRKTGIWEKIMEFISFSSVITNAAIIAFSSLWIKQNLFSKFIDTAKDEELLAARLGFILVFEHIIFVSKIILRAAIPSVPLTIKLAIQRSKYMNRFANGGLDSGMDDDDYYNDDMDSLYHSDITDSDENSDPNEIISTLGPSAQRPNDQIELRNGHNTIILGGTEEVNENTAARTKKNSRPGLESARSWSSRILRLGEPSSKIE
ncbi:hypothetical protein FBU30_010183 [Linnemannia zychae]|nr:hypothetical protein FBU30_010183 [Linnemannia zychae]